MNTNQPKLLLSRALVPLLLVVAAQGCDVTAQSNNDSNAQCQSAIATFLRDPTEGSLAALSADDHDCWTELRASPADLQRLDRLAANGNLHAARLLARHLQSLGGGELGDAYRALGQFGALHTEEFLGLALSEGLTSRRVSEAITMLPLDTEENPTAHLAEMRSRRSALDRVSDPQVAEAKEAALAAVDSFIEEIQQAEAALDAEGRKELQ